MNVQSISDTLLLVISLVFLGISFRAFFVYVRTRSDMLFILALAMGCLGLGTIWGYIGNVGNPYGLIHLGGVVFSTRWAWMISSTGSVLFLFLASLVKTSEQLRLIKRWQVIGAALFVIVLLVSLALPAPSPITQVTVNSLRVLILFVGFLRYTTLYLSKETRFCLIMSLAFVLLALSYGIITPQLLQPSFPLLTAIGSLLRVAGSSALLLAYSIR